MNFLGMGPMELLLIAILALIVFGPSKLPEIMGQIGKGINDFRKATSELTDEFNKTIQAEVQQTRQAVEGTPPPASPPAPELVSAPPAAAASEPPVTSSQDWQWEGAPTPPAEAHPADGKAAAKPGSEADLLPPY